MSNGWRSILRRIEPQGIPWPASALYNALARSAIFQRHYELVARDIARYCTAGRILDVGTGPGWLLLKLREVLPGAELAGMDISWAMVAQAAQNLDRTGHPEISLRTAHAESLPFGDASFDAVVSTGSLHHWRNPAAALNEIHRVLREGGRALLYDLVRKAPREIAEQAGKEFGRFRCALWGLHSFEEPFYSSDEMKALARKTRFESGETRFVGMLCCLVLVRTPAPNSR